MNRALHQPLPIRGNDPDNVYLDLDWYGPPSRILTNGERIYHRFSNLELTCVEQARKTNELYSKQIRFEQNR
ncbi:MAG: hypothetical protein ACOC38_08840 [Promethearchaeia archaeon]